jgi:hypothetical protein
MQSWEYLFVETNSGPNDLNVWVRAINGQHVLNEGLIALEYIQQMGAEGWEMVGITLSKNMMFIFKRPKP